MTTKITQPISNSNSFPDIERTIEIAGMSMNFDLQTLDLFCRIIYKKDGQDISRMFGGQIVPSLHINNTRRIVIRDVNLNPVPNPDFVEKTNDEGLVLNQDERFITKPAFDYFLSLLEQLKDAVKHYAITEDQEGRFNF